jgi:hypothetical protein
VASIQQNDNIDYEGDVVSVNVHLDSHADCCVFSEHATILYSDISRTVSLTPFKTGLGIGQDLPVSTVAIAYDDPKNFYTYVLIFHEALVVHGMAHHIFCPNQLRDNDVRVQDVPLMYTPVHERNELTHTISTENLIIPLMMDGVHSSFSSRVPTDQELANPDQFPHIHLTSERIWEPHDDSFHNNELAIRSSLTYSRYTPSTTREISEINLSLSDISPVLDDDQFVRLLSVSAIITSDYLVS